MMATGQTIWPLLFLLSLFQSFNFLHRHLELLKQIN